METKTICIIFNEHPVSPRNTSPNVNKMGILFYVYFNITAERVS